MPGPPLAYVEHDGRVFTVVRDGRRTLPSLSEVPFPVEERGRLHVGGAEIVVGAAALVRHPREWVLKDDVPLLPDADPILGAAVLGSLYRPVVGVLAVRDGQVLVVKPSRGVVAGRWTLPGGFLLPFEDPEEGARREMREETGLRPGPLVHLGVWLHRLRVLQFPILGLAYACREAAGTIAFDKDEIDDVRWMGIDEARRGTGMLAEVLERWGGFARAMG